MTAPSIFLLRENRNTDFCLDYSFARIEVLSWPDFVAVIIEMKVGS
jgi:hypothetical protein